MSLVPSILTSTILSRNETLGIISVALEQLLTWRAGPQETGKCGKVLRLPQPNLPLPPETVGWMPF